MSISVAILLMSTISLSGPNTWTLWNKGFTYSLTYFTFTLGQDRKGEKTLCVLRKYRCLYHKKLQQTCW